MYTVFIFNIYTATAKRVLTANRKLRNQRLHSRGLGGTPISTLGKICALLGITQHVVVITCRLFYIYRRFETTCVPHLQGSRLRPMDQDGVQY